MKKRVTAACLALLLALALAGCARKPNDGEGPFVLGRYVLEEEGIATLVEELRHYEDFPATLRVSGFGGDVDRKGVLLDFNLSLYGYDENLEYIGTHRFTYTKQNGLEITRDEAYELIPAYNENADVAFLDGQIKRIRLRDQLDLLRFDRYAVAFNDMTRPEAGTPIVDGGDGQPFPLLTLEEVRAGQGGVSDGASGVYLTLYDGVSLAGDNLLYYRLETADEETITGNRDFVMPCDYRIYNDTFSFTRDYGETWIDAELPPGALDETLAFYRNGLVIPEDSYSITEHPGALALLYGEEATLLLSGDDGETWRSIPLDLEFARLEEYPLPITRRVVHFFDGQNGYLGLGTDWSMGTGEAKALFRTRDGGENWEITPLPQTGTSTLLSGLAFADMETGVLSLKHPYNQEEPVVLYYTTDGGANWQPFELDPATLPEGYDSLQKVDSFTLKDGGYALVFGQGDEKVRYTSGSPSGPWQYESHWQAVYHTVG